MDKDYADFVVAGRSTDRLHVRERTDGLWAVTAGQGTHHAATALFDRDGLYDLVETLLEQFALRTEDRSAQVGGGDGRGHCGCQGLGGSCQL